MVTGLDGKMRPSRRVDRGRDRQVHALRSAGKSPPHGRRGVRSGGLDILWIVATVPRARPGRHTGLLRHLSRDLGVYLDGELYVTGRIADLVIIDGGCRRTSAITSAQCASSAAATGGRSLTCGASTTAARTRSAARGARPRSGASQISPPAGHRRIRRGSARERRDSGCMEMCWSGASGRNHV